MRGQSKRREGLLSTRSKVGVRIMSATADRRPTREPTRRHGFARLGRDDQRPRLLVDTDAMSTAYPFRRGAAIVVNSCCEEKKDKSWGPNEALVAEFEKLVALLPTRGFTVIESLKGDEASSPKASDVKALFDKLADTDFSEFDALIVILMAHGGENKMKAWPEVDHPDKPSDVDLRSDVFSKFQLQAPDSPTSTRASETLKGKPKVFLMEMCRIGNHLPDTPLTITHALGWAERPKGWMGSTVADAGEQPKTKFAKLSQVNKDALHAAALHIVPSWYRADGGGDVFTRYHDFLFGWATVPFNPSGIHNASSSCLFLSTFRDLLQTQPSRPMHELLVETNSKVANWAKDYAQCSEVGSTLRRSLVLVRPHNPTLSPTVVSRSLFGREDLLKELGGRLLETTAPSKYVFVVGSAGLGKTELVKQVARGLVSGVSPYSAVIFVELRAKDTFESVHEAVKAATDEALAHVGISHKDQPAGVIPGILRDSLLILDNADDPYKSKSNSEKSEQSDTSGWFERLLALELPEQYGTILITLRDEGNKPPSQMRVVALPLLRYPSSTPVWQANKSSSRTRRSM